MKSTVDIYIGSPIEIESERNFLDRLSTDLRERGESALIFANFFPSKNPFQIDFLVITSKCVCHIELKNYTDPIVGDINGPWKLRMPSGSLKSLDGKNPYRQALDCKYAISDQMHDLVARNATLPGPPTGKKFYTQLGSVVCIFPDLLPGSTVISDYKVQIKGYSDLLKFLLTPGLTPGWNKEHWTTFAMDLKLVRQEGADDLTDLETVTAHRALDDYAKRFREFYNAGMHDLVPTTLYLGDGAVKSDHSLGFLLEGRHGQLIGPSGCGKTHLAKHMMLSAIIAGRLPILIQAQDYDGKLSSLLDKGVAPFHPNTALHFLKLAEKTGTPLALIVDGYNECSESLRERLIKDLQALYIRCPMPVLFTSQCEIELPESLRGAKLQFGVLTQEERKAILHSYSAGAVAQDVEQLCQPFQTAYELSLAAKLISEMPGRPTRAILFDAYIRRCCDRTSNPAVARRILREIAGLMGERLATTLPITELWRLVEHVLEEQGTPLSFFEGLRASGLLEVDQWRCTFRHELLKHFLEAEALLFNHREISELGVELRRPRNRHLVEFIIGVQTEVGRARRCVQATPDFKILRECLLGHLGDGAKEAVFTDVLQLFQAAGRGLEGIDVDLPESESTWDPLILSGAPAWSEYDCALMSAIGTALSDGLFIDETLQLVEATESVCRSSLMRKASDANNRRRYLKSHLFAALYKFGGPDNQSFLPASRIVRACHDNFSRVKDLEPANGVLALCDNLGERSAGALYLICLLFPSNGERAASVLPKLLKVCWDSKIYHLRLEALQVARRFATILEGGTRRDEIEQVLATLDTTNIFLQSARVEVMVAYDMIQSPVSVPDAVEEIAEILKTPDDTSAQANAWWAVSKRFEEVFGDTYYTAMEGLTREDRVQLLTMAVLGIRDIEFSVDWVLEELVELGDRNALKGFLRWATAINADTGFAQAATACYFYAVKGCAPFLDLPPRLRVQETNDHRAWQLYGEIIFWMHKPGLSEAEVLTKCAPLWERLQTELSFEAVDPLMQLQNSLYNKMTDSARRPVREIFTRFREPIRRILEFGLGNLDRLTTIYRLGSSWIQKEHPEFIIQTLGKVGNLQTVKILEPYIESPQLGPLVVETIRKLKAGMQ